MNICVGRLGLSTLFLWYSLGRSICKGVAVGANQTGLSRIHAGKQGDNYYVFFSPGKADYHHPTVEAKSLTIYAEVQKSGVSSILSFWRVFPIDS